MSGGRFAVSCPLSPVTDRIPTAPHSIRYLPCRQSAPVQRVDPFHNMVRQSCHQRTVFRVVSTGVSAAKSAAYFPGHVRL